MSVRTITYNFNGLAVSPDTLQYGGVRFEDNATTVEFILDTAFKQEIEQEFSGCKICYRIDFNGEISGYNPSENLEVNENRVRRSIPLCMTASGEQITAVLVVTAINGSNEAVGTVSSIPLKIYFDNVSRDETDGVEIADNVSAMEIKTKELCELSKSFSKRASDSAAEAAAAADCAQDAREQTEDARFALENGSEFVFLGGDSEGGVDIELVVDEEISGVSVNPVQNRAIAAAINAAKDELKTYTDNEIATIAEQGTSGIWTYRKWNSGIVECWASIRNIPSNPTGTSGHTFVTAYPFTVYNPIVNVTSVRFGWTHTRPIYIAKGNTSLDISYYFDINGTVNGTPLTQCDFSFDVYVKGKWK